MGCDQHSKFIQTGTLETAFATACSSGQFNTVSHWFADVLFKARHMSAKCHITLDGQLVKVNRSHKVTNSGVLSHHLCGLTGPLMSPFTVRTWHPSPPNNELCFLTVSELCWPCTLYWAFCVCLLCWTAVRRGCNWPRHFTGCRCATNTRALYDSPACCTQVEYKQNKTDTEIKTMKETIQEL